MRRRAPAKGKSFAKWDCSRSHQERLEVIEGLVRRGYGQYAVVGGAERAWSEGCAGGNEV